MSRRIAFLRWRPSLLADERGGAHVLVLALLAAGTAVGIAVTGLNVLLQSAAKNSLKPALDAATHAASLDIDRSEASYGRLAWDQTAGEAAFRSVLYRNLKLDASGVPTSGSPLPAAPVIHVLAYVTNGSYPYDYEAVVTVNPGTVGEIVRTVATRIYGPSIVSVVEFRHKQFGGGEEPIVLSSVSSIRPRY